MSSCTDTASSPDSEEASPSPAPVDAAATSDQDASHDRETPQAGPDTPFHALLVGVTNYPGIDEAYHLEGPGNDVLLMAKLLREKFGFSEQAITILSETEGKQDPAKFPTRDNIQREFTRLSTAAGQGDQVVIYMAGHGSQQPASHDPDDPEEDGLDEMFLPRDIQQSISNAIVDDEIHAWLAPIRARGASVWITMDACHSGTMVRGMSERVRQIPACELGIPKEAISDARRQADQHTTGGPSRGQDDRAPVSSWNLYKQAEQGGEGGMVAIYACQPREVTVECLLPEGATDRKYYGLLCYYINKVMTQAMENSSGPITYRELVERVYAEYVKMPRRSPVPFIEGPDQDREVLGVKEYPGRPAIVLNARRRINAGKIHGLCEGNILKVLPPAGSGDEVLGHVQISQAGLFESTIEPHEMEESADLPVGARCEPIYVDFGDSRMRVAVDVVDRDGAQLRDADRKSLQQRLKELETDNSIFHLVDDPQDAEFLVRPGADAVYLVPAAEAEKPEGSDGPALYGPIAEGDDMVNTLRKNLQRIARVVCLQKLANSSAAGGSMASVQVELFLDASAAGQAKERPILWQEQGITLYNEDDIVVRFRNPGPDDVDVTILYIDDDYGINCLFPVGEKNRLEKEDSHEIPLGVKADKLELGHLVVIAVRGDGEPINFAALEQPSLPRTRDGALNRALQSPLGKLLATTVYGEGTTRGVARKDIRDYSIDMITWQIRPEKRLQLDPENGERTRSLPDRFPGPVSRTPGPRYRARYYEESDNEASEKKEPASVRVFYGTDRKRASVYNNRVSFCVAAVLTAVFGLGAWRISSRRKTMIVLSLAALVCTILLRPDYARIASRLYGNESGHELEMGICTVTIPPEHELGEIETPTIYRLQFREDPQEHIVIQEIKPMGDGAFFTELQKEVENKQGELFVYIHGYYNSFEYAAQRTAQMAYDFRVKYGYDAVPVFYSWPSQGTSLDYLADARAVKGTVRHLRDFLTEVASRSGARAVNVIAHSMGNRALTDALKEMQRAASEQSVMFNEVILAAPDVDKRVFCTEIAPSITKTAKRFTLYASSDDLLLAVSEMLHRAPRAGRSNDPPPVLLDGVETIDATGIDTSLFGHTYIASSPLLLRDLSELLRSSRGADQRPWLRPRQHDGRVYWALSDGSGVEAESDLADSGSVNTGPPSDTKDATTPLSNRPVISRSSFQDETEIRDRLDLAAHVDKSLRDAASGGGDFVFVDIPESSGAYSLVGRYGVEANRVTVTVVFARMGTVLERFDVSGEVAKVDELAQQIVAEICKRFRSGE